MENQFLDVKDKNKVEKLEKNTWNTSYELIDITDRTKEHNLKINNHNLKNSPIKHCTTTTNLQELKNLIKLIEKESTLDKSSSKEPRALIRRFSKTAANINSILVEIFNSLSNNKQTVSAIALRSYLRENGFLSDDPRWSEVYNKINATDELNLDTFSNVFSNYISGLSKINNQSFVIDDFAIFTEILTEIFESKSFDSSGNTYQEIKRLKEQNPDKFGMSFCSIDGQRFNLGDYNDCFCVQECSFPITFGIALETIGLENYSKKVACEPSGKAFDSISFTNENIPNNPFINCGAILTGALVVQSLHIHENFEKMMNWWKRLAGGYKPGFDITTYISTLESADNNYHLAYYVKNAKLFPENVDIEEVMEFYFQCSSIEMSCSKMAVVAATLANGGVCPISHERVFTSTTTKNILSTMFSCGMNNHSGQFAFKVGIPAKSGVSGCIMVVIPSVGGFCTWSPRLDKYGNSKRGISFFEELVNKFSFHNFDIISNIPRKHSDELVLSEEIEHEEQKLIWNLKDEKENRINPLNQRLNYDEAISSLLFAACENDINTLQTMIMKDIDLDISDYDKRTALHVAASEGHLEAVKYLVENGANTKVLDRFKNTPLEDAKRGKHKDVIIYLSQLDQLD